MTGLTRSTLVLAAGSVTAAAAFWALLNVPESNLFALLLSLVLAVVIAAVAGLTVSLALLPLRSQSPRLSMRQAIPGVAGFLLATAVFAALWWAATSTLDAWNGRRGEIDAAILYWSGVTSTAWLHASFDWTMWGIRWLLGPSIVAGITAAAVTGGFTAVPAGFTVAFRLRPIAALAAAIAVIGYALRPAAYWRPQFLPANRLEIVFAVVKLGLLYAAALGLVAFALRVYSGAAAEATSRRS